MLAIDNLATQLTGIAYDKSTGKILSRLDSDTLIVVGIINSNYVDSAYVSNGILTFSFDSNYNPISDGLSPIVSLQVLDDNADLITWEVEEYNYSKSSPIKIVSGTGGTPPYSIVLSKDPKDEFLLEGITFTGTTVNGRPEIGISDSYSQDDFIKLEMIFSHEGAYVSNYNHPLSLKLLNVGVPLINLKGSVSTQISTPNGLALSDDNTIIAAVDDTTNAVHEYEFAQISDIQSLQKTNKSFPIYSFQGTSPSDIEFNSSGNSMFISDKNDKKIYQYSLSTPYDISTSLYDVSYYEANDIVKSGFLSKDGKKYYTVPSDGRNIVQYNLSEPYNISSITKEATKDLGVYDQTFAYNVRFWWPGFPNYYSYMGSGYWYVRYVHQSFIQDICFSEDGKYLYVVYGIAQFRGQLRRYTLSTPWDIRTISSTFDSIFHEIGEGVNVYYPNPNKNNGVWGMRVSDDGSKLYILDKTNNAVYQYNFGTNYDIDTISSTIDFSNADTVYYLTQVPTSVYVTGLEFKGDGSKFYVSNDENIFEYSLTNPWELSNVSYVGSFTINEINNTTRSIDLKDDGSSLYIQSFEKISQFTLSQPYDISTAALAKIDRVLALESYIRPTGLYLNDSENTMYVTCDETNSVYEYTLSTPNEISTGTLTGTFNAPATVTDLQGIEFSDDESKFVLISSNSMLEFNLGPTLDSSSFNGNLYNSTGAVNALKGFRYTSDGGFFITTGTSSSQFDVYSTSTLFSIKPI